MTYYEEFGISSSATQEEIRQAHRRLVKILHPDLQIDAATRQLAELQTSRINGIAGILLDPTRREEYDSGCKTQKLPIPNRYDRVTGFAITGLCVFFCLWLLQADRPAATVQGAAAALPAPESAPPAPPPNRRAVVTESGSTLPRAAHPAASHSAVDPPAREIQLASNSEVGRPEPEKRPPPAAVKPDEPPSADPPAERKAAPPASGAPEEHNPLIGTWVYVPAPLAEEDKNLYRPEYIEMRIRDVKGLIEGQYRARYHVPDRPLSPNVGFHFASQPGASQPANTFRWSGSNGLAGRVELKLMSANSIQVDWRVTELAESADLVSGTAILTRVR